VLVAQHDAVMTGKFRFFSVFLTLYLCATFCLSLQELRSVLVALP
jgi:hypothetical protein